METFADYAVKKKRKLHSPGDYKVVLYNDNFTTMEFVVEILVFIFNKSQEQAESIMLEVHEQGRGIAGVYTKDIALTKAHEVIAMARQNEFPLKCTVEKV
ncbi:ATP-dependent Clp protease adapter protein ClpS [Spirochaetia bacterium]|nr:ATP-dependent Clp protease adapter protein ClpS [Spirochaetia bacterium]